MKTDLKEILSISGQPGLFQYLAQAKNGVIVESLSTKNRTSFGINAKVTSLADISIYTNEDEVSLKEVLKNMAAKLGGAAAPTSKSETKVIKAFFAEVLPNYDEDRFYVSHMKKVLDWYSVLSQYASLDFVEEEEKEDPAEEKASVAEENSEAK